MDINKEYIEKLIQRCLDRTATPNERSTLLHVLKYIEDEEIEGKIIQAFYLNTLINQPSDNVWGKIETATIARQKLRSTRYKVMRPFFKYAAILILFLLLPFYFYRDMLPSSVTNHKIVRHVTEFLKSSPLSVPDAEEAIQLVLPGGQRIDLFAQDTTLISQEGNIEVKQESDQISYTYLDSSAVTDNHQQDIYHTLRVPYGKRISVKLVDGSLVYLNSGTELRYPVNVTKEHMNLYLEGEAYFDVAKSKERQFDVHIKGDKQKRGHVVQVLGTKFNVRAFKDTPQSKTTLLDGSIQISGLAEVPVLLQPLQAITVDQQFSIQDADIDMALAWMNHMFYFKHTPMSEVCIELERWYGVKVNYQKRDAEKMLLGQISRDKKLHEVLDMLAQTQDIKYYFKGKEVYLME